jgi:transcriptional regulator with GAF, ATPase, and Fis domain
VAVNCSAIGEQLIESELFGHRKGAFTGAHHDRAGAFVTAHHGTLLLDELGDAPLRVQLALLRALETRRIKPVGSDREQEIDVRVLAATSADVRELMHSGHFREDLYFRLAELVVDVPPLRARPEDIPDLVEALLKRLNAPSRLSPQALEMLIAYSFPGNVRELENALKRALALSRGATTLEAVHFSQLGPVVTATAMVEFQFPAAVRELAKRIWAEPRGAETEGSKYEQRARVRAALLEIGSRFPLEAWPKALQTQWSRLFGAKWATTEGGRNVREVARELGLEARREESERRVLGLVRGVVMRRVG